MDWGGVFEKEMAGWEMARSITMPSFARKDEAMFVWKRFKVRLQIINETW